MKDREYKNYLLSVLVAIMASNYVDRQVFGLLLQDIKVDLSLSDTQLGFLTGIAFALFYAVMGIPIARWADRGNRITIIALATATWSAVVTMFGLASSFLHLLLIRIFAAVGEAGLVPPAHSLIADYFSRAERPRAVGIFKLGGPLSVVIGYFLAGWLNEIFGWRMTFMMLGLPGVGLAALAWFTLKDPRFDRHTQTDTASTNLVDQPIGVTRKHTQPTMKEVFMTLWANRTFRHLLFGYSVIMLFGSGINKWQPAFFIRSHGLQTGELGTWLAIVSGGGGLLGTYLGGMWASRHAAQNERLQLKSMAIAYSAFGVVYAGIFLASHVYLAFALMGLALIGGSLATGPLFATIQTLVPERMRAMSIAIIYLFANLIGMGLGPLAVGVLSDALRPWLGEESLRYALIALCPGYLWVGCHLWLASRTVTRDLELVQDKPSGIPGH